MIFLGTLFSYFSLDCPVLTMLRQCLWVQVSWPCFHQIQGILLSFQFLWNYQGFLPIYKTSFGKCLAWSFVQTLLLLESPDTGIVCTVCSETGQAEAREDLETNEICMHDISDLQHSERETTWWLVCFGIDVLTILHSQKNCTREPPIYSLGFQVRLYVCNLIVSSSTIDIFYQNYTFYKNRYQIYIFCENGCKFGSYFRKKCKIGTYFGKNCQW